MTPSTIAWALLISSTGQPAPSPEMLLRGVVDARTTIRSASIEFTIRTHLSDALGPRGHDFSVRYHVVSKDDRYRVLKRETLPAILDYKLSPGIKVDEQMASDPIVADRLRREGVLVDKLRETICIFTPEVAYRLLDNEISIQDRQSLWSTNGVDFRCIGLSPLSDVPRNSASIEDSLYVDDPWEWVAAESVAGTECYHLRREAKALSDDIWIAPGPGFMVLRRVVAGDGEEHVMEADYRQFGDVWFPESIERRTTENGVLAEVNELTVENAEFDLPAISDDLLNLKALGAPPDTPVVDYRSNQAVGTWNGETIEEFPPLDKAASPVNAGPFRGGIEEGLSISNMFWIASGASLILACGLLFYRRRQLR